MDLKIVSREIVKPSSSSTSHNHPTIHNLSFFDQLEPHMYVPLLFFYTCKYGETETDRIHRSYFLKSSLSVVLSHYYPLAGRIKDDVTVDCNDNGALFLEAQTECNLHEILMNPDEETLRLLCPDGLYHKDSFQVGPVVIQVTYFKCGGMSIGLCLCHKMMDMATMSSFINDWASLARKSDHEIIDPEFNIGSLYPPLDLPNLKQMHLAFPEMKDLVTRRLVFYGSKIAKLKEMVANQVPNPTRAEVVTALLFKSAINATAIATCSLGTLKTSVMTHIINLRTLVSPPLSNRNKGNMVLNFQVSPAENKEANLGRFVEEFRRSKTQFSNACANPSNMEELCQWMLNGMKSLPELSNVERDIYICSSWCRNSLYESDFGWGKPLWISTIGFKLKNTMCWIDTREGDGIEVFINLEEKVMAAFEQDEQLLSFCTINPSIVDLQTCV